MHQNLLFYFDETNTNLKTLKVIIPLDIATKKQLIDILKGALFFPEYFGDNWDALEECLCDFSWLKERQIVIIHHDLPLAAQLKELKIYMDILVSSLIYWKKKSNHQLFVVFPIDKKKKIEQLIN